MTLALIAGQGGLPPHLVRVMLARGEVPLLCEIEQFPSEIKGELPRFNFRLETLGTLLATLKEAGAKKICMAGSMRRPAIDPSKIDAATMPLVARVQRALTQSGDDGTLRVFVDIFQDAGFEVVGATAIDPGLLPQVGVIGDVALPDTVGKDVQSARAALLEMSQQDQGQAVVVINGVVVAREDARGTDAMLKDLDKDTPELGLTDDPLDLIGDALESVADWLSGPEAERKSALKSQNRTHPNGILFKAPKQGQELRVDMPVIGEQTVINAAKVGLSGIVVEEGGVMMLNPDGVARVLKKHGIFLWVCPRSAS